MTDARHAATYPARAESQNRGLSGLFCVRVSSVRRRYSAQEGSYLVERVPPLSELRPNLGEFLLRRPDLDGSIDTAGGRFELSTLNAMTEKRRSLGAHKSGSVLRSPPSQLLAPFFRFTANDPIEGRGLTIGDVWGNVEDVVCKGYIRRHR